MKRSSPSGKPESCFLPPPIGHGREESTLCIGLDIAWFGGSRNDRDSHYDFICAAVYEPELIESEVECIRVPLVNRDPEAALTADAMKSLIGRYEARVKRIVLAVDAPLQTCQGDPGAPKKKQFRQCERHFSMCRKAIDKAVGGSSGWHPNVQPGVPLAPRVTSLLKKLSQMCGLQPWTKETAETSKLTIECFPAEAIWAAKRLDQFPENLVATDAKAYKSQQGSRLSAAQVRRLVETTLLGSFKFLTGVPRFWPPLVEGILSWMLADKEWQKDGFFRGGKLLDDVVDSSICLATALSYASNNAHFWQHPDHPDDGHIVGPGRFGDCEVQGVIS